MQLEKVAERMRACGSSNARSGDGDSVLRVVVGASNGFLFEQLIRAADHEDADCADLLRFGARILGELTRSGIGIPCECGDVTSVHELWETHIANNKSLCKRLQAGRDVDDQTEQRKQQLVHEATMSDASLGRVTMPVPIDASCAEGYVLQPRFGIEQILCCCFPAV